MSTDLALLQQLLKRNLIVQAVICSIIAAIGGTLVWYGMEPGPGELIHWFRVILGAILLLIASGFLTSGYLQTRKSRNKLWQLLENEPQKIVWVYHYIVENKPYGVQLLKFTTVYFNTIDGDRHEMMVPLNKAEALLNALRPRLPHATFGHSEKKEFFYLSNPGLLRK